MSEFKTLLAEADRVSQVLPAEARAHRNSISMAEAVSGTQIFPARRSRNQKGSG